MDYVNYTSNCMNGNRACKMCYIQTCPHPSIMCSVQGCGCSSKHSHCMMQYDLSKFFIDLKQKENKQQRVFQQIKRTYDLILKQVKADQIQFLKEVQSSQIQKLGTSEKTFFDLLVNGPVTRITPVMAYNMIESIQSCSDQNIMPKLNKVQAKMENVCQQIRHNLSIIRCLWKKEQLSDVKKGFIFNSEEHCSSNVDVFNNGKSIQLLRDYVSFALLSPSISQIKQRVVEAKLRIVRSKQGVCLGMVNYNKLKPQLLKSLSNGESAYLIDSNGKTYNKFDKKQDHKMCSLRFSTGDIIQMEFNTLSLKLRIQKDDYYYVMNINSKDVDNNLRFCVITSTKTDEIEIIR